MKNKILATDVIMPVVFKVNENSDNCVFVRFFLLDDNRITVYPILLPELNDEELKLTLPIVNQIIDSLRINPLLKKMMIFYMKPGDPSSSFTYVKLVNNEYEFKIRKQRDESLKNYVKQVIENNSIERLININDNPIERRFILCEVDDKFLLMSIDSSIENMFDSVLLHDVIHEVTIGRDSYYIRNEYQCNSLIYQDIANKWLKNSLLVNREKNKELINDTLMKINENEIMYIKFGNKTLDSINKIKINKDIFTLKELCLSLDLDLSFYE